ncbi:protein-disulfide reductase DsbD domain-containing protein, partial [Ferrovibrio sp.]|uniref:protein-disulfide reductase DsbD domain-containing protein n=1 Tax=Ferrovibrio sp. TaxID=1917215 RepID=UPI00311E6D98
MPVLYRAVLLAMLLLGIPAVPAIAQTAGALSGPDTRELVQADLIAEPAAVTPGQPFWVGVRLRMKEHWHTYWRNPGDSGLASAVDWRLPEGFAAGPIVWPAPQRLPVAHLVNFGYEGEILLLTEIVPPAAAISATSVSIGGTLSFLVCETICIPGEAELALTLPVAPPGQATAEPASQATFAAARAALPQPAPWPVTVEAGKEAVMLQVAAAGLRADANRTAFLIPHAETLNDHAAPQAQTV